MMRLDHDYKVLKELQEILGEGFQVLIVINFQQSGKIDRETPLGNSLQ